MSKVLETLLTKLQAELREVDFQIYNAERSFFITKKTTPAWFARLSHINVLQKKRRLVISRLIVVKLLVEKENEKKSKWKKIQKELISAGKYDHEYQPI